VELEICVYFRVAVVPRTIYTAREAGNDIYEISINISIHCYFSFLRMLKSEKK
jgi:hypothetical protein